ncbi:hypothetical protein DICPUDRAFT_81658 [Dictyostelium purpureum]|uniref:Uncharacterized protein n=1 Tax=Dictyostelium purpureum TaxID=5786 RepID=F0ZU66_DICPU|nr:uncharacterized protein DICPUDRAFT_81658 [Dictyostelium purpureum]EGC32516.1 hypothetical protein DICPUDRAFT_81658 [Dictyostelium purpureum]|eukprot:XP_003290966.1 hypothetical protein DICPUDRAFT_81658 [Dictyostelium purpureum]
MEKMNYNKLKKLRTGMTYLKDDFFCKCGNLLVNNSMCLNGHTFCNDCAIKGKYCIVCYTDLSKISKDLVLERDVKKIRIKCPNDNSHITSIGDLKDHLVDCKKNNRVLYISISVIVLLIIIFCVHRFYVF